MVFLAGESTLTISRTTDDGSRGGCVPVQKLNSFLVRQMQEWSSMKRTVEWTVCRWWYLAMWSITEESPCVLVILNRVHHEGQNSAHWDVYEDNSGDEVTYNLPVNTEIPGEKERIKREWGKMIIGHAPVVDLWGTTRSVTTGRVERQPGGMSTVVQTRAKLAFSEWNCRSRTSPAYSLFELTHPREYSDCSLLSTKKFTERWQQKLLSVPQLNL